MDESVEINRVSLITPRDVMYQAAGRLKSELTLRSSITKNNIVRTVPMTNETLVHHLELYIAYRIKNDIGMLPEHTDEFRGLSPDLPLIMSGRGSGFVLATKKRVLQTGVTEEYKAADTLEQLFRVLYKAGGYHGASSHSGRRSFATRLIESGVAIEDVSLLLGHQSVDFTLPYLETSADNLRAAFEVAL